ncbi:MAG TPA: LysR family transcriptional regulator, partial [Urbifossiella sp.]|nr:LysR family transcriptional regulator [Urbifossiella sp.]
MAADAPGWGLKVRVWVERDGRKVLGPGRVELLGHIDRLRSITAAAKQMGMSYRRAWELVRDMNEAAGVPLVAATPGGPGGGGATVTPHGHRAVRLYEHLIGRFARTAADADL